MIQRYFNVEDWRKGKYVSASLLGEKLVKEEPILVNCLVLGEQEIPQLLEAQILMNKDTLDNDKEMVRKIENEDLPMLSFSPVIESFRFEEDNEDNFLHNIYCESHPLVCTQVKYETFKFEEDDIKNDFWSSQAYDDPILEPFCSEDHAKLSILEEICIDGKTGIFIDNSFTKSGILVEEKDARTYFVQGSLVANEMLQHHEDGSELDYIFLYHEMEVNRVLVPAKCKSSTSDLSIDILSSNKDF